MLQMASNKNNKPPQICSESSQKKYVVFFHTLVGVKILHFLKFSLVTKFQMLFETEKNYLEVDKTRLILDPPPITQTPKFVNIYIFLTICIHIP